jgi:hypothetical protein
MNKLYDCAIGSDHREYLEPAVNSPCCNEGSPDGYICTREIGHPGDHAAHMRMSKENGDMIERWGDDPIPKDIRAKYEFIRKPEKIRRIVLDGDEE